MEITRKDDNGDDTTRLYHASVEGSISSLNTLIQKDPLILRRFSLTTFSETPLLGHLEFSKILLTHNPKLAAEVDSSRRLPLHLASAEGHKEVVQALLNENPDACLRCDQQGRVPLHYAAMRGRLEVVKELMHAKPESIAFMDESGGTSLHLCVQHNHLDCLEFLVKEAGENTLFFKSDASCNTGITILRLALMLKQTETIRYLLSLPSIREEADVVNGTLFNTFEHCPIDFRSLEIQQILMDAGANRNKRNENLPQSKSTEVGKMTIIKALLTWLKMKLIQWFNYNKGDRWLEETRGHLMIVATMISAMTFQVAIYPPGGVWQDTAYNSTINGGVEGICSKQDECIAGTAVLGYIWPESFLKFVKYNTISFVASITLTVFLISGIPLTNRLCVWFLSMIMCITVTFTGLTYLYGVLLVMPENEVLFLVWARYKPSGFHVWIGLVAAITVFHTFRFLAWLVRQGMNLKSLFKSWVKKSIEDGPTVA